MEKTIKLYENYKEMLLRHHNEVMKELKSIEDLASTDGDLRDFIHELMSCASSINTDISIVETRIKRLKRQRREQLLKEEA